MTFASSSSDNNKLNSMKQWAIALRRKWLFAIYILAAVISYPITTIVKLTGDINRLTGAMPEVSFKSILIQDFSNIIGFDNVSFLAVIALAFITALQGYAFLYHRHTIDFYESQPVKRSTHFWKIYLNGFLMFLFTFAAGYVLAFIVAGAMGVFRLALLAEALIEFLELSLLFLGVYSITILGAVVSGTLIMGILVSGFLLAAEVMIRGMLYICAETYLATFYYASIRIWNVISSPIFTYFGTAERLSYRYSEDSVYRIDSVISHIRQAVAPDIRMLLIAAVAAVLAWCAFKYRKSESAGHSVVFPLIEWIIKFVCAFMACILVGVLLDIVTQGSVAVAIIGIIITAFLICAIAEIVFESDFKAMFKHPWHIAVAAVVGIAVILGYRFDITGYETYIPAAKNVESCALFDLYGMGKSYYSDKGLPIGDNDIYFKENMILTDIEGVQDIAKIGQETQVKFGRTYNGLNIAYNNDEPYLMQDGENSEDGWSRVVMYRMKNGRVIYRKLLIPESTDPALLDRVTGSTEYSFALLNLDDGLNEKVKQTEAYSELIFDTGCQQQSTGGEVFDGFIEAYKKDVEENYCFTLAYTSKPVGTVYYTPDNHFYGGQDSYYLSYNIFPEYKRTIEFLKKNDMYFEEILPLKLVDYVTVYYDPNVYKTYDEDEEYEYEDVRDKEYRDADVINTLMDNVHYDGEDWSWRPNDYTDYSLEVTVNMQKDFNGNNGSRGSSYMLYFQRNKVPDFVITDLGVEEKD